MNTAETKRVTAAADAVQLNFTLLHDCATSHRPDSAPVALSIE